MSRRLFYVLCLSLIAGGVGCGDDDDDQGDAGLDGAVTGSGGSSSKDASAGGAGSGGATTGGSGGMGGDAGDLYECVPPAPEPGGDAKKGDPCCDGLGVCATDSDGSGTSLDVCAAGKHLTCAPVVSGDSDAGDEDGGAGGPIESCRVELPKALGDFDLEGRCVPACFVAGDASAANLGQSTCDKGSKCVPCYSPITGQSTGACEAAGDHPAEAAPKGFTTCGDGDVGYCVSAGMVAGMAMLPQLNCAKDEVCAPKVKVLDQSACFAHCDSVIGGPGACIAAYIIPEAMRGLLQKSTCDDGDVCAPCINPLNMMSTGACR
jgi:hypothetical protein